MGIWRYRYGLHLVPEKPVEPPAPIPKWVWWTLAAAIVAVVFEWIWALG